MWEHMYIYVDDTHAVNAIRESKLPLNSPTFHEYLWAKRQAQISIVYLHVFDVQIFNLKM